MWVTHVRRECHSRISSTTRRWERAPLARTIAPEQLDRVKVTNDPAVTAIAKLGERLVVLLDAPAALAGVELSR